MSTNELLKDEIKLAEMPAVPGLRFRRFQGESDYPLMVDVLESTREVDEREWVSSVEETAVDYAHLTNCDPYTEMILLRWMVNWWDTAVAGGTTW